MLGLFDTETSGRTCAIPEHPDCPGSCGERAEQPSRPVLFRYEIRETTAFNRSMKATPLPTELHALGDASGRRWNSCAWRRQRLGADWDAQWGLWLTTDPDMYLG